MIGKNLGKSETHSTATFEKAVDAVISSDWMLIQKTGQSQTFTIKPEEHFFLKLME